MYFTASTFVTLQLHVCIMKVILCHLQKNVSAKIAKYAPNLMPSLKTNPEIPLKHIGRCIQILANLSNYVLIKIHFNYW